MDLFGSAGNDTLSPLSEYQRIFGLDGADFLMLGSGFEGVLLSGGKGADRYVITAALSGLNFVLDAGASANDSFSDSGFLRGVNYIAELDGRHLIMMDSRTGGGMLFIDWQSAENRIENWSMSFLTDVVWNDAAFGSLIRKQAAYQGVVSLDTLGTALAAETRRDIDLSILAANTAGDASAIRDPAQQMLAQGRIVTPQIADGSFGLQWVLITDQSDDVIIGTTGNDFINSGNGNDAIDGGTGNDILDGGAGSNFLSGGAGTDNFFIDGRNADGGAGRTVWSTITDFNTASDETVAIWGWVAGTSRIVSTVIDGAVGYKGATWHIDLTGDGTVDASVTLANVSPNSIMSVTGVSAGNGYLMLG
ncbi:calcium-binding protein [Niveispirillum sp. KHB5.9]|uniref:calcium-binding protein n=1 Tax=Niveispirillum sp. KHB5.9 TaxID=3400269 RepID=UPI003A87783D